MERCEDRRMLSGDAFIGTIELFGDSLTDADGGGFFYRLDQGGEVGLDFTADLVPLRLAESLDISQQHLRANGQFVAQPSSSTSYQTIGLRFSIYIEGAFYASAFPYTSAFSDLSDTDSDGLNIPPDGSQVSSESLQGFISKSIITRIPLIPPAMASFDHPPEDVISLAGLFDTNQRTHDTELLAIRSALLASHHNQPLGSEAANVSQPMDRVILQEAESESTWDRVWTFDLASFSSSLPLANPNDVTEVSSEPRSVTHPLHRPVSLLPADDSLGRVLIEQDAVVSVEDLAINVRSQDQAFAEFDPTGFDSMDLPSNAWGLAADRRGGWAISAVALLVAQRAWSISSTPAKKDEEKEEPRWSNDTTK